MNPATRYRILYGDNAKPRRKLPREELVLRKSYWEHFYRITIPEEVWTPELRRFMLKYLFRRKFLVEDNSHGSSPSACHASKRFRAVGEGTVVGSFKKYRVTAKLLECLIEFNMENDNERHSGLYAVLVNKVFEAPLFFLWNIAPTCIVKTVT
jgi:hypothetical protein